MKWNKSKQGPRLKESLGRKSKWKLFSYMSGQTNAPKRPYHCCCEDILEQKKISLSIWGTQKSQHWNPIAFPFLWEKMFPTKHEQLGNSFLVSERECQGILIFLDFWSSNEMSKYYLGSQTYCFICINMVFATNSVWPSTPFYFSSLPLTRSMQRLQTKNMLFLSFVKKRQSQIKVFSSFFDLGR